MLHDDDFDDFFAASDDSGDDDHAGSGESALPRMLPPRLGMLAELDDAEFDHVARAAKLAHLDPDVVVFRQGDPADRFFIVVDGAEAERRIAQTPQHAFGEPRSDD